MDWFAAIEVRFRGDHVMKQFDRSLRRLLQRHFLTKHSRHSSLLQWRCKAPTPIRLLPEHTLTLGPASVYAHSYRPRFSPLWRSVVFRCWASRVAAASRSAFW